jgi:hypothetical protein
MKKAATGDYARIAAFSWEQTSGLIATGWSRWKKGASRAALRAVVVSTRANPN